MVRAKPVLLVEALATRNDSGLGKLARMFVDALSGLSEDFDVRVILPRDAAYRPAHPCRIILARPRPLRAWIQTVFPALILWQRPRVVICLGQTIPRWRPRARYALLIPDAGPLEDARRAMSSHDAYNRRWLAKNAARADSILTIAEFTKERLTSLIALPRDRIAVVKPIGAPEAPAPSPRAEAPAGDYFLAVGNVEPRKNFPGLLEAYARLRARRADVPPLHIAGHKAWGWAEAEAVLDRLDLRGKVFFTGYLPVTSLRAYLEHCAAFVSSSLYEGWGLPLFEALALGKPALYHAGSAQEEFARGLALPVDCGDPEGLSVGLEKLMDPEERRKWGEAARAGFPAIAKYDLQGELREALRPLMH